MEQRYHNSAKEVSTMTTAELRGNFLVDSLMKADEISFVYSHYDRVIVGSAVPANGPISLPNYPELRAEYFLERRELGIINIGGPGEVVIDAQTFAINKLDCVFAGKGSKEVTFKSLDATNPAKYYLLSAPAHKEYPASLMKKEDATPVSIGSAETSNARTIYKYIHLDGIRSSQLVMGLTVLSTGSVWNTMPSHTHDRRMEMYFYFDVTPGQVVLHLMGEPQQTKHLVMKNNEAVISPPWSIHSGCGTANYSFIWGMAGENQVYSDMDPVAIDELK
ncbi:5-dehydro-4-deoxy-D-glucuronate isomerase [Mucilaginibacter paludis]|uniref:4-deoxy-L-threo-5-hexosulose-uronate ketol-isomerase n=1 Tax=Mucilaginibacter paludis DSM 18603 TaxID=714943 RepID=H1XZS0_9SPHI|nr:5-dehydro-4-deoxy-D-glucuronate isomerase [Mucilaginibacter paludis]EHQ27762.1 4-deoxy-L-threo-5-hexosulose-uronateketol-isomer ase [Mucilaginibacter paludis DSM 18603]